jgi:hypothetical protein
MADDEVPVGVLAEDEGSAPDAPVPIPPVLAVLPLKETVVFPDAASRARSA